MDIQGIGRGQIPTNKTKKTINAGVHQEIFPCNVLLATARDRSSSRCLNQRNAIRIDLDQNGLLPTAGVRDRNG